MKIEINIPNLKEELIERWKHCWITSKIAIVSLIIGFVFMSALPEFLACLLILPSLLYWFMMPCIILSENDESWNNTVTGYTSYNGFFHSDVMREIEIIQTPNGKYHTSMRCGPFGSKNIVYFTTDTSGSSSFEDAMKRVETARDTYLSSVRAGASSKKVVAIVPASRPKDNHEG